ncbi:APC family permease [Nocardioides nitrophenolicus]|uniref:APC family permease n=1 Tax=Nocardioides nitrophenolicus TaxID=60489 RepID=UPI0027DB3F9A|nr:APC family permease [Nocardioides nitrophenolicus]
MVSNQPTELAAEQHALLHKSLRRFDIVFLLIAAVVGLETLGQVSGYGAEAFTWALVLAVFFLVPYGLIFAETGAAFSEEGGAYTWVRDAFGRPAAAVAAILTWITQPVWVGGSMAFLAAETVSSYLTPIEHGSLGDYVFKVVFIWITVLAAVVSLQKGKWLPTSGALLKVGLLVFFVLTTVVYAIQNGVVALHPGDFSPTLLGLFGSVPILLFAYLGFESSNSAAGEMENPARDVPVSILRSCATAAACYLVPIMAILLVVPAEDITGIGGLFDAVGTVYSVYGGAADVLLKLTAVVFVYILMSQGAAWMIISDRMQAMTAADGSFFGGFFGRFHPGLGTPVRVNMLSGVVSTTFMLVAMQVTGDGASIFGVVLTISISTFLLSYLLVIPAAIRLRTRYPDKERPFRVPVSDRQFAVLGWIAFAWVLLGSWVAVFPGTLERLFGEDYPFEEYWGVSQATFEVFTLGTLAFLLALCAVGYALGAPVRASGATITPDTEEISR